MRRGTVRRDTVTPSEMAEEQLVIEHLWREVGGVFRLCQQKRKWRGGGGAAMAMVMVWG